MLVNIYGSKELFVKEYGNLLADRILTHFNYDTEKEIRYLELLKLRFGESQLHFCEVMLKDVADSRRINHRITELITQAQDKKPEPSPDQSKTEDTKTVVIISNCHYHHSYTVLKSTSFCVGTRILCFYGLIITYLHYCYMAFVVLYSTSL